ncbi:MAG: hypothetical protein J6Z26_07215 [Bacteroidales bacterium]|nr:hypothetical protein [Bacteroidales bacterium]
MKKLFLTIAVIAGAMFFASCEEEAMQEIVAEITGKAACTIGGGEEGGESLEEVSFSSSMAMSKEDFEKANQYTIGLAMKMTINQLLHLDDSTSIIFPMLAYRLTGTVNTGDVFTVNNALSPADTVDFDYRSLIDGKFAGRQLVGVAVSKSKFYLMKSGTITITETNDSKIVGEFDGRAYTIDLNANPKVDFAQSVAFSGSFQSRWTTMLGWIINMQNEGGPQGE